jgi:hypothetical protein
MRRLLFRFWVVGIALLVRVVFTAERFFVRKHGPFAGYLIGFAFWVFLAAMSYLAFRLFAWTFLQN